MLEHGRPWRLPWRLDLVQELLRLREDFEVFDVCVARMIDRGCEHFGRARFDGRTQLGDEQAAASANATGADPSS